MGDSPHYFVTGKCFLCGALISFDPERVPSVALNKIGLLAKHPAEIVTREPLCRDCTLKINEDRKRASMEGAWDTDPSIWEPVEGYPP